ncbi:hypothetical protein HMP0721_0438 [Pseudoramibacter alactolyticus ATCC 23263]|uniref:Uncharacterized protein n=1 Tax=Pseudoramibacter alactolyticus ATCC 23263 TaxID=887929 RepID=E6MEK5_9FIRM|nr:hypothetical protein HMP0721_0438 [Pseudoramibacter alactolyticus ATCC 23263]
MMPSAFFIALSLRIVLNETFLLYRCELHIIFLYFKLLHEAE